MEEAGGLMVDIGPGLVDACPGPGVPLGTGCGVAPESIEGRALSQSPWDLGFVLLDCKIEPREHCGRAQRWRL